MNYIFTSDYPLLGGSRPKQTRGCEFRQAGHDQPFCPAGPCHDTHAYLASFAKCVNVRTALDVSHDFVYGGLRNVSNKIDFFSVFGS